MTYDIIYIPLGAAALGGAERSIAFLAQGMARQGKKVLILAERALQKTAYPELVKDLGLDLEWVDWAPEHSLAHNLAAVTRTFRRHRAKVIHFNISWRRGMWLIPLVARLMGGMRLIGSMRAMPDPHQNVPRRMHFGFIPGLQLWHVPEVVAGWMWGHLLDITVSVNGTDYPARLTRHYGYPQRRIRVIHNGVFLRETPMSETARQARRRRMGVDADDVLVAYVGRLSVEKGVEHLVESLKHLPPRFKLAIAGEGPSQNGLKALAMELGLGTRVVFLGFVSDPEEVLAAADLAALPSIWHEACPRVVVEAMNQGVPVVGTRLGGTPELITEGVEGVTVEPGSAQALAQAIGALGTDAERRRAMGQAARQRARSSYSMEAVVQRYGLLYRELNLS